MRPRKTLFAALVATAALGVSACGDDDDDESAATPPTPAETAPAEEAAPEAGAQDIVALAQATPDLSTLVEAVTAAELVETLQGEGPFTVFAPSNDAFTALGDALPPLLEPEAKDQLAGVLTYHVVPGALTAADLEDGQTLETVQGESLTVSVEGETVRINDATVAMADVEASNGVVHVIDGVLMPPS